VSASFDVLVFEMDGVYLAAAFRIHIPAYNAFEGNQAIDLAELVLAGRKSDIVTWR